jgi:hypothetical protein
MNSNQTAHEKAVEYFNSLSPLQRYEIMQKVEKPKSINKYYRNCINYILKNKLFDN